MFYGKLDECAVRKYNVVWFVVDALRADAVGFTEYDGKPEQGEASITPYLDQLAEESWVFSNAYTQSSMTMLSCRACSRGAGPER